MTVAIFRPGDPIARLVEAVERGAIVAFPTESSYGLGVDPESATAVAELFRLKGRDGGKALPVVAGSAAQIRRLPIRPDSLALAWGERFWPAALTVALPLARPVPAAAGESTLAVRVPDSPALRALLSDLGRPLTATSANRSGEAPLLDPLAVLAWLEETQVDAVVVDFGVAAPGGPPSTLVELDLAGRPRVLRQGAFRLTPEADLEPAGTGERRP